MRNRLSILGSTGSIGTQAVDVAKTHGFEVLALAAGSNIELLEKQARELRPKFIAVYERERAEKLAENLSDMDIEVSFGPRALTMAATYPGVDTVLAAMSGTKGLLPTLEAVKKRKRIALANKETLVMAGRIFMEAVKRYGAELIPVDSEHSAIFQCLGGKREFLSKIYLTASGGPFRGRSFEELENVQPEEALRHPNWSMGAKITIDSATLMNKGLELIEAMHLFNLKPDKIEILVHPESVVHSMVEFVDGSVLAQLGVPDMRLPIQYAISYPKRLPSPAKRLSFKENSSLKFMEPDLKAFPCLRLAIEAAEAGGNSPAILSAANEIAVSLFLQKRIGFNDIYRLVADTLSSLPYESEPSLEALLSYDRRARSFLEEKYS